MGIVAERHLDLASVQSAWQGLNKLVPLGPITSEKDFKHRVQVMDELLDRIGTNESHRLMPLLDLVTKEVEAYEAKQQALPEASPAKVLAFLMEEAIRSGRRAGWAKHRFRHPERQARTQYVPGEGACGAFQRLACCVFVSLIDPAFQRR
jgi:hypothetical protein